MNDAALIKKAEAQLKRKKSSSKKKASKKKTSKRRKPAKRRKTAEQRVHALELENQRLRMQHEVFGRPVRKRKSTAKPRKPKAKKAKKKAKKKAVSKAEFKRRMAAGKAKAARARRRGAR